MPFPGPQAGNVSPDMLLAMVNDPRTPPDQKFAIGKQLQAMGLWAGPKGGAGLGGMAQGADDGGGMDAGGDDAGGGAAGGFDPTAALSAGETAAKGRPGMGGGGMPGAPRGAAGGSGGGDLAGWHGDFLDMIKKAMAADTGGDEPLTGEDKGLALARAGFGVAASRSPHLGVALGEGGLQGIQGLDKMRAQRAQERLRRDALAQAGALREDTLNQSAATAKQASLDRQASIQAKKDADAQASLDRGAALDVRKDALAAGADAKADAAAALAETKYTSADTRRRQLYSTTGQWQTIAGDNDHGVAGPPESTEYTGPLIESPKLSPKQKQVLEAARPKNEMAAKTAVNSMGDMVRKAEDLLKHPGLEGATGLGGTLASSVPGSRWKDFQAQLKSTGANSFVTSLQNMRASSPTGGALGNVSDREGDKMESLISSLEQAQSPEQMRKSLNDIVSYGKRGGENFRQAYVETYGDKGAPPLPWEKAGAPSADAGAGAEDAAYATANDVKAAFKAGKLSRESAAKILKEKFNM